jgi:hypothetical protein
LFDSIQPGAKELGHADGRGLRIAHAHAPCLQPLPGPYRPHEEVYSPDMVAEVAERLLALEGMKWSLAWGTFANQLFVSIRTTDRRVNAGRLIREICEDLGGSAGGHGSMAGARIPMHGTRAQRERFKRQLLRRFLLELGQDEGKGRPLLRMARQGRP